MSNSAPVIWIVFKREFKGYFATPIAYVFLAIFVFLSGIFAFYIGNYFSRGQADLQPFFTFHPWLYLVLIPALAMRLWAEERRGGTIELLLTLPITMTQAVDRDISCGMGVYRSRSGNDFPYVALGELPG